MLQFSSRVMATTAQHFHSVLMLRKAPAEDKVVHGGLIKIKFFLADYLLMARQLEWDQKELRGKCALITSLFPRRRACSYVAGTGSFCLRFTATHTLHFWNEIKTNCTLRGGAGNDLGVDSVTLGLIFFGNVCFLSRLVVISPLRHPLLKKINSVSSFLQGELVMWPSTSRSTLRKCEKKRFHCTLWYTFWIGAHKKPLNANIRTS